MGKLVRGTPRRLLPHTLQSIILAGREVCKRTYAKDDNI